MAISYLRVSTTRQLNTAADLDEDGNSIATQREWAIRKARELGVPILREFVEPGQSAQTIDKRPEFKKLLRFVDANPDVRYVVIYMRSRVFRNHLDAAITKRQLRDKGVELISAKENFGDGYMGDAMEAITDVVNELLVRMSGEDIRIKMAHKVERGGSVGRAKLGYLNVRKDFDGRLVNTIDVDPVRAPLIVWAFEQYATNQFSITQLQMMLEDQGLTTRQSSKRAAKPLSSSQLAMILRDPYYTGVIRYKGKLHPGRHMPLISKELFLAVQKILDGRNRKGDRDRIHSTSCAACCTAPNASRRGARVDSSTARTRGTAARTSTTSAPRSSAVTARCRRRDSTNSKTRWRDGSRLNASMVRTSRPYARRSDALSSNFRRQTRKRRTPSAHS
ncbi:recombinase family protein [Microbacterium phosphatis]|uniref:recombinase family protein n=1 Tax=Microbacterium phosphatis TaxID=3140248 RepID=UPI00314070DF